MMTIYEIISIIIAIAAFLFSLNAFFSSKRIAVAQIELYMNERITNTKEKVSEQASIIAPFKAKKTLSEEEKSLLEIYEKIFFSAVENNLNAYEEACAKYLDKKVDCERFKKTYKKEIRQLVENKNLKKYFDAVSSSYKAILKVYKEWENLEK